jgi:periplasmic protein TonB
LVTYVDLNAIQHPAPLTAPPQETTPPNIAQPQLPPATPEAPVSTPLPPQPETATARPVPPQETKVEEQRSHTIMGLGLTKGYFKSLGEGESLRAGIKEYYLEMLQSINERWWIDQKIDKRRLAPVVINITVARNGDIVASRILRSSGHPLYDKAVLAALTAASPLPPLPADYDQDFFQAPIRLVPPLNLMAW